MHGALRLGKAAARMGTRRGIFMVPVSPTRFPIQPTICAVRCLQLRYSSTEHTPSPEEANEEDPLSPGETLLYRETQQFTVRMMLGVSGVNFLYWGSQVVNSIVYKGVVVQGIDLGGDPMWSLVGSFATGLIVFFTRSYAHHSVYQAYESEDGGRIGFQMHTVLGYPGRKFEVSRGKARFITPVNALTRSAEEEQAADKKTGFVGSLMKTSMIPVTVEGFDGNVLFDESGSYYNKDRLVELLTIEKVTVEQQTAVSKDTRMEWKNSLKKGKKARK
mmetsp:Transcript_14766/g.33186  ORF Transcript_14766/g.33186 Transcript_14766/m.33186 type:complete len:275 (+) Transcript_14766:92-916(+)